MNVAKRCLIIQTSASPTAGRHNQVPAAMKACRAVPLLLIALSSPALATSTMCTFGAAKGDLRYAFQFIGYGEVAMIQVDAPDGLRIPGFKILEFDERSRKIHLVYDSPGGEGVMPSFTLKGAGKNVRMNVAGQELTGELHCGD